MSNATHIVMTTIGNGRILLDLSENACRYHRHATVWVIGDRKTLPECATYCELASGCGLDVRYLSPDAQDEAGKRFPEFYARLPWNSDARRNLGYLLAYEAGCERLILLDDDNYPGEDDFIGGHSITGGAYDGPGIMAIGGYYDYLQNNADGNLSPRGYPYFARGNNSAHIVSLRGCVGVNIGVWTGDPDVDAATWLAGRPRIAEWWRLPAVLAPGTWTPVNSQNTCIARELIPAAFFVIQRYPGADFMDRFGDIFAGYFLQAAMGDALVRIGSPIAVHRRNRHDYVSDLAQEAPAISLLEWLLPRLEEFKSGETTAAARYLELADYIESIIGGLPKRLEWAGRWLLETTKSMRAYTSACLAITGGSA